MTIAIDASGETSSFAISHEGKIIGSFKTETNKISSSIFPGLLSDVLLALGKNINDAEKLVVSIGPGSYTGLRISLSLAKALSFSLNIPIIPVNILDVGIYLLNSLPENENKLMIAAVDARRNEAYVKVMLNGDLIVDTTPLIFSEEVFSEFKKYPVWIAGNAGDKIKRLMIYHDVFNFDFLQPSAESMLHMILRKKTENHIQADEVMPLYIKEFQTNSSKNRFL